MKIQNGGSNIVVQNFLNSSIFMRICIHWVFGSLISNTLSGFQNSNSIQYGGKKFLKISNFYGNLYIGVFGDADNESAERLKIQNGGFNLTVDL